MASGTSKKSLFIRPFTGVLLLFLVLVVPGISRAEIVKDVSLQYMGAETVARSVIMAQIQTSVGSELDSVVVEEDIHNLVEAEASRKAEVVRTAQDHHIVEEDIQTLLRWMLLN